MISPYQFWHRSVPTEEGKEIKPGWNVHTIISDYEAEFGTLSAYYSKMAPNILPHAPHSHNFHELFVIRSGALELIHGSDVFKASPKSIVYFPPSQVNHSSRCISSEPAEFFIIRWRDKNNFGLCNADRFSTFQWEEFRGHENSDNSCVRSAGSVTLCSGYKIEFLFCKLSSKERGRLHIDKTDSLTAVLEGEYVDVIAPAKAPALIFYAAGVPHGTAEQELKANIHLTMAFYKPPTTVITASDENA